MIRPKKYLEAVLETDLSEDIVLSPLTRLPLYALLGSRVEFAEPVQHTGELPTAHRFTIGFDDTYPGFEGSELGKYIGLSNTY